MVVKLVPLIQGLCEEAAGDSRPLPLSYPQKFLFVCLYPEYVGMLSKVPFHQRFPGL